jgi:hypothetical protein
VFAPPNAPAYLTVNTRDPGIVDESLTGVINHAGITSPLYLGIENSRRFRALALFASLMSLGKEGYQGELAVGKPLPKLDPSIQILSDGISNSPVVWQNTSTSRALSS